MKNFDISGYGGRTTIKSSNELLDEVITELIHSNVEITGVDTKYDDQISG